MIISKTPFRISFFGGGTDYPAWYKENKGAVLSTTIDKYCYITIRYLPPFFEHKHRIVYSEVERVKDTNEIRHPAVKAILKSHSITQGVEIHHDGDLPARSGLGSSSSFTVGLLHSLYTLKGTAVSKMQLAKEAIYMEREILKESVGSQDQVAVSHGGFNKIIFNSDNEFQVEPIDLKQERLDSLKSHLMLVFTGLSRFASEIAEEQIKNTPQRKRELTAMQEMVDQAVCVLKGNGEIGEFGALLDEAWKLKKSFSHKISTPLVDDIYRKALKGGALGGKILGAGGGGFMLLFVPPEKREKVRGELKGFLEVSFSFEGKGSQIIHYSES